MVPAVKVLCLYCHPCEESFTAAVRDTALGTLRGNGHEVKLIDLHAEGFEPVMGAEERRLYHEREINVRPIAEHLELIRWAEALVFIYPTWWYGLPAMLKGWLDRVWVPHETFAMPEPGKGIQPMMTNIRAMVVLSTCGAPFWWMRWVGDPGKRTLLRGVRALCHPRCKTLWLAHYLMDSSTPESREKHLRKVETRLARALPMQRSGSQSAAQSSATASP